MRITQALCSAMTKGKLIVRCLFFVTVIYVIVQGISYYRKFSATTLNLVPSDDEEIPKWALSDATAKVFTGERKRVYPHRMLFKTVAAKSIGSTNERLKPWCEKWGVVTTIFDVSEAVHRQVCTIHVFYLHWCIIAKYECR